jgi:hypothetical protein
VGGAKGCHVRSRLAPPLHEVVAPRGRVFAVIGFTVARGRIVAIDVFADPEKLRGLTFGE